MGKMSNLDLVLDDMITAVQKMIEAANALKEMFSGTAEPEPKKATKKKGSRRRTCYCYCRNRST